MHLFKPDWLLGAYVNHVILSNNPSLGDNVSGIQVRHVAGGIEEIYNAISHALQDGYELVSSPLPPNVPLIRSPFRSVILRQITRRYDAAGILVLEKARERTKVLGVKNEGRILKDLEFIDRDHLLRAIAQMKELGGYMACN